MAAKRFPLEKRFSAAMSNTAYDRLRRLNDRYKLSNNYLLTVLLENLDEITDGDRLDTVFKDFIAEYGAPSGTMKSKKGGA